MSYEAPVERLGWLLSARNNSLRLERQLRDLQADDDAYSFDDETRLERFGETIRLAGPWDDEELELPFAEFCAAAQGFLDWMRSQPAIESNEMFVLLAGWLSGATTLAEIRHRDRRYDYDTLTGVELTSEETEQRLRADLERFAGPIESPETAEKLAVILARQIDSGQNDPRTGAFAIAGLAPLVEGRESERAHGIRGFVELVRTAREVEGQPAQVAELESRIANAAKGLAAT